MDPDAHPRLRQIAEQGFNCRHRMDLSPGRTAADSTTARRSCPRIAARRVSTAQRLVSQPPIRISMQFGGGRMLSGDGPRPSRQAGDHRQADVTGVWSSPGRRHTHGRAPWQLPSHEHRFGGTWRPPCGPGWCAEPDNARISARALPAMDLGALKRDQSSPPQTEPAARHLSGMPRLTCRNAR
jgi:hypothetical protein